MIVGYGLRLIIGGSFLTVFIVRGFRAILVRHGRILCGCLGFCISLLSSYGRVKVGFI